jgi:hypothetical protein
VTGPQVNVNELVMQRDFTGLGSCTFNTAPWSLNRSFGQLSQSGTPGNFSFRFESQSSSPTAPQGTITATFSGGLANGVFTGSITVTDQFVFGSGATRNGTVVVPVTLNFVD